MMDRENILAILYDLAVVMGGEVNLKPMLTKTLQRLLYHTSFPCGMILLDIQKQTGDGNIEARLTLSIGDYELASYNGKAITAPAALLRGETAMVEDRSMLSALPCRKDYYSVFLRIPIDNSGVILLLSPCRPDADMPLAGIFQPIMNNLAKAILLCRHNDAYTQTLLSERDSARLEFERISHRNKLILDSVGDGIYGADIEGKTTFVNPNAAKILGYEPEELLGKKIHEIIHHKKADGSPYPEEACPIYRSFKDGSLQRAEDEVFWKKDGTTVPVEYVSAPIIEGDRIVGSVVVFEDITKRKEAEESLKKVNRALRTISSCNTTLIYAADETGLLRDICRIITEAGGYRMAWIGFAEQDAAKTLRFAAAAGEDGSFLELMRLTWADAGQCIVGPVMSAGKPFMIRNILTDPRCAPCRDEAAKRGYLSAIALPLKMNSNVFGALVIHASQIDAFNEEEVKLLEELAGDLSYGVMSLRARAERDQAVQERQQFVDRLRENLENTVQAIAATIEMRDPYTAGHQRRVADLSAAIAREMGLSEERVHALHIAGVIHDLGKIYIPAEILSKPMRLNDAEFNLIKLHPQMGYDILKEVKFQWPIARMVLQHHEKLDGSGYPQGLKGDEIMLEAKILVVADEVEALASHRPYRPALGLNAGIEEITKNRGICYDPDVVDACVKLFRKKRYSFE